MMPNNQYSPLFPIDYTGGAYEKTPHCHKGTQIFLGLISLGIAFTRRVTLAIVQRVDHLPSVVGLDHD